MECSDGKCVISPCSASNCGACGSSNCESAGCTWIPSKGCVSPTFDNCNPHSLGDYWDSGLGYKYACCSYGSAKDKTQITVF